MLKKRSVIFTWLISYFFLLLIPTIVLSITYFFTGKVIEQEIIQSNVFFLGKLQQHMDNLMKDVQKLGVEIALNGKVQEAIQLNGTSNPIDSYLLVKTADELKAFNSGLNNTSISQIYVYCKNINTGLAPGTVYKGTDFRLAFDEFKNLSNDEWMKFISGSYKGKILNASNFSSASGENSLIYALSLPIISTEEVQGNVFLKIQKDKLLIKSGDNKEKERGTTFIMNSKGDIIIEAKGFYEQADGLVKYEEMPEKSGILHLSIKGTKYVVNYTTSELNDWKYVNVVPAGVFWEKAQYVKNLTIIGIFLCIFVGIFISYFSFKKNYNPLKSLINLLEGNLKKRFEKTENEFSYIQKEISKVFDEKMEINQRLMMQNKALREAFLVDLLKGRTRQLPTYELMSSYEVGFQYDKYAVIIFYVENMEEFLSEEKEMDSFEKNKLLKFAIGNVVEELANKKHLAYMVEVDYMQVCIINLKEESSWKSDLEAIIQEARAFLGRHFNLVLTEAVSEINIGAAGISNAYLQALRVLEYKRIIGMEKILFASDIEETSTGEYYYPIEKEHQLINFIKTGDYSSAEMLITEIFDKNFTENQLSIEMAKCLMFDMVSTIIKTLNEMDSIAKSGFLSEIPSIESLISCGSINQIKSRLPQLLNRVCSYIAAENAKNDYQVRDRIINYIDKNYANEMLSVSTISEEFGMNLSYLSRVFKEQSGMGILDYISMVRVGKAKEYIESGNVKNLEELAKLVGYSNTKTFTRTFKKMEGITPGKYK